MPVQGKLGAEAGLLIGSRSIRATGNAVSTSAIASGGIVTDPEKSPLSYIKRIN
jgi:hypothetical protein